MIPIPGSDSWTVRKVLSGHPEAFEALVYRYQRKAFAIARALGVPHSSLEDVVQDAFLQSLRDLASLKEHQRFRPWFMQIVRNTSHRFVKKILTRSPGPFPESQAACGEPLEDRDLREYLKRKVEELPGGYREAIFIYYYEGGSVGEVARALAISRSAAKKRLQRARDLLRGDLWRELGEVLRDTLPTAREWKRRGRHLVLLALASLPFSLRTRAAGAALAPPGLPFVSGPTSVMLDTKAALFLVGLLALGGVLFMLSRQDKPVEVRVAALPVTPPPAAKSLLPVTEGSRPEQPDASVPKLREAPTFFVQVEDSEGEFIETARPALVWISPGRGEDRSISSPWEPMEGVGGGLFVARGLLTESAVLTVAAPGFLPLFQEIVVVPGISSEPMVVVLEKGEELHGQTVDFLSGGTPLACVQIGPLGTNPRLFDLGPGRSPVPGTGPPADLDASAVVELSYEVKSDAEGRFLLTDLPATIWAARDGYSPTVLRLQGDWGRTRDRSLVIPLYPPTTVRIRVRHADGAGVERFTYRLAERLQDLSDPPYLRGSEGCEAVQSIYHLCQVRAGMAVPIDEIALGLQSGNSSDKRLVKLELGGENRVEVVLPSAVASIQGRVLDPDGAPLPGASISAGDVDSRLNPGETGEVRITGQTSSNEQGRYQITLAGKRSPIALLVQHSDYPPFIVEDLWPAPGRSMHLDLQLGRGGRVLLTMAGGPESCVGGKVHLEAPVSCGLRGIINYRRSANLDPAGRGEIEGVSSGVWDLVWVDSRSRIARRSRISVLPGRTCSVILGRPAGSEGVEVQGTLSSRGRSVEGQRLSLRSYGSPSLMDLVRSDSQGRFLFSRIPPGNYILALEQWRDGPRSLPLCLPLVVPQGSEPLLMDLTTTALIGKVTSLGQPVALVEVVPHRKEFLDGQHLWRSGPGARTDQHGLFRLSGLYQASYLLVFQRDGYFRREIAWRPGADEEEVLPEVVLEPADGRGTLSFRALGPDGREELSSIRVDVYSLERAEELQVVSISRSSAGGRLTVNGVPSGRYRAYFTNKAGGDKEFASSVIDFEWQANAGGEIEATLQPGGQVNLQVLGEEGLLPLSAEVEVIDSLGRPEPLTWNGTRLRFHGCTVLRGVPLGELLLRLEVPGGERFEVPVWVEADRPAKVVQVLPARPGP